MLTTLGFQIAFYSLCALIVVLALVSIVRRRRRTRLLSQRPNEPLNRLDRLQRELQDAAHQPTEQLRDISHVGEAQAVSLTAADRSPNADSVSVYRPQKTSA